MSDLLARLKASGSALATVDLSLGKTGASSTQCVSHEPLLVGLRILTERDYQDAGFAAAALLAERETDLNLMTADLVESEKTTQLLVRMMVDPATSKSLFDSAQVARETLTRDQRTAVSRAYLEHEKAYAPSERTMPDAEFAALLDALKKTPQKVSLNDLSFAALKRLLLALVEPPTN